MGIFSGIAPISQWFSSSPECHAFLMGFCESFHLRRHDMYNDEISQELHYYDVGMMTGDMLKICGIIATGIWVWKRKKGGDI